MNWFRLVPSRSAACARSACNVRGIRRSRRPLGAGFARSSGSSVGTEGAAWTLTLADSTDLKPSAQHSRGDIAARYPLGLADLSAQLAQRLGAGAAKRVPVRGRAPLRSPAGSAPRSTAAERCAAHAWRELVVRSRATRAPRRARACAQRPRRGPWPPRAPAGRSAPGRARAGREERGAAAWRPGDGAGSRRRSSESRMPGATRPGAGRTGRRP